MISKQAENYFKSRLLGKFSDKLIEMTVSGNSMWPFLRHGQEVVVRRLMKDENCNIGDIVVIKVRSFFMIHRVLFRRTIKKSNSWEYFTKGDRRLVGDGWSEGENIVGLVQARQIGRLFNFLVAIYSVGLALAGKMLRRS